jgi:hypothetical protein
VLHGGRAIGPRRRTVTKCGFKPPKHGDVKIYFQGSTGAGKSLLRRAITDTLRSRGLDVEQTYVSIPQDKQIVDLTRQNADDVLLVRDVVDKHGLEKISPARRQAARGRPNSTGWNTPAGTTRRGRQTQRASR